MLHRRLQALPAGPLSLIARATGRPSRRASKQLLDAYGPLDCGLRLQGTDTVASVLAMLDQNRRPFTHITAVSLPWTHVESPSATEACSSFVAAIPTAFPRLQSLSLSSLALHPSRQPSLSHLTALSSCLTSLTVPCGRGLAAALQRMQPLTHLRSLTITGDWIPQASSKGLLEVMGELNSLPQLQHLQLCDTDFYARARQCLSAAAHLPSLRCADSLTHLACGLHLVDWDEAALSTLRSGLPRLSSLALNIGRPDSPGDAELAPDPTAAILAAISRRTVLTALALQLEHPDSDDCTFQPLSSLRLASCRAQLAENCDTASLLEALAVQRSLTQLRLQLGYELAGRPEAFGSACLRHLASMAETLQFLEVGVALDPAANVMEAVGKLTNLRTLQLSDMTSTRQAAWAASDVLCLTQLRSLEVLDVEDDATGFVATVVGIASLLVGLKELRLRCSNDQPTDTDALGISDSDLSRLAPLQPHLTRLVLDELKNVRGPGYETLRGMAGLQQLDLVSMGIKSLHLHLLPLPLSMRTIRLYLQNSSRPINEACAEVAALREAGRRQDCTVTVEDLSDWLATLP
jgi:hypothetical protein